MESPPGIGGRDAPLSRSPAVRKALSRNLNALPETRKVRGSETLIPHAKGNPFSKDLRIRRISDQKEATSGSNSPRTQIAINVVKQECPTGRDQRQPRATSGTQFQNAPRFSLSLFLCHLDKSLPRLRFTPAPPQPTPNSSAKSVKGTGMEEKTTLTGRCIQDAEKKTLQDQQFCAYRIFHRPKDIQPSKSARSSFQGSGSRAEAEKTVPK